MKSKTSFFNPGIAKNLLRRCWPLWVCYLAALLAILPLALMRVVNSHYTEEISIAGALGYATMVSSQMLSILSLIMGALTAMVVFGYLYNTRGMGLMNSLPVTRTTMFWTAWLTGLLPMLAADVVAALCCLPMVVGHGLAIRYVLLWLGAAVMSNIAYFGFASFCATLTGSVIILPLVYLVLNFTAVVAEGAASEVFSHIVYGLTYQVERLSWLSPPAHLTAYYTVWQMGDRVIFQGYEAFPVYCAAGLIFALLGWLLYRRRRMETAGDTVSIPVLKPVFQYCMAFGTALVFATLVYSGILNLDLHGLKATALELLLLLVGAFLGYYVAEMLLQKTVKVFRGHWKGLLITWAVLLLLVAAGELDVTGCERRVPDADKIETVGFQGVDYRQPENIQALVSLHRAIIADKDRNEHFLDTFDGEYYGGEEQNVRLPVTIQYWMKDGSSVLRTYSIAGDQTVLADPDSVLNRTAELANVQEALEYRTHTDIPVIPENVTYFTVDFNHVTAEGDGYTDQIRLTPQEAVDFYNNAVLPDLAEGHIARRVFWETAERDAIITNASLSLQLTDQAAVEAGAVWEQKTSWFNFQICSDAVHCMDWIEEHTGERPVLMQELDRENTVWYDLGFGLG